MKVTGQQQPRRSPDMLVIIVLVIVILVVDVLGADFHDEVAKLVSM